MLQVLKKIPKNQEKSWNIPKNMGKSPVFFALRLASSRVHRVPRFIRCGPRRWPHHAPAVAEALRGATGDEDLRCRSHVFWHQNLWGMMVTYGYLIMVEWLINLINNPWLIFMVWHENFLMMVNHGEWMMVNVQLNSINLWLMMLFCRWYSHWLMVND